MYMNMDVRMCGCMHVLCSYATFSTFPDFATLVVQDHGELCATPAKMYPVTFRVTLTGD